MKMSGIAFVALLFFSLTASAQSGWRDGSGDPIPESESSKSSEGFSAKLLVTPDKDWQEKWNTSPETVPQFTEASDVGEGGELFILAFLANPKVDASGMTDVACDFTVERPDGSKSINEVDMPCFKVQLTTDPTHVYLSAANLKFVAEPADPRGTWVVRITMKDRVRGIELPLQTSFVVQ